MLPQLFVSNEKPEPHKMQPARNEMSPPGKPRGGIWTSSYDPACYSAWYDYASQHYELAEAELWMLQPEATAKILELDTWQECSAFVDQHGQDLFPDLPETVAGEPVTRMFWVDWEKVGQKYDAVHLTHRAVHQCKFHPTTELRAAVERQEKYDFFKAFFFDSWSCESTFWFRWKFSKVERLAR